MATCSLELFSDASRFQEAVERVLLQHEDESNLPLAMIRLLAREEAPPSEFFAVVRHAEKILFAAFYCPFTSSLFTCPIVGEELLQTVDEPSQVPPTVVAAAMELVADALFKVKGADLGGCDGPLRSNAHFLQAWEARCASAGFPIVSVKHMDEVGFALSADMVSAEVCQAVAARTDEPLLEAGCAASHGAVYMRWKQAFQEHVGFPPPIPFGTPEFAAAAIKELQATDRVFVLTALRPQQQQQQQQEEEEQEDNAAAGAAGGNGDGGGDGASQTQQQQQQSQQQSQPQQMVRVPVCVTKVSGRTRNGARIGMMYTPPEFRRCGYATAATLLMVRHILRHMGCARAYLFADAAYPPSNIVYQNVGFRPVSAYASFALKPAASSSVAPAAGAGEQQQEEPQAAEGAAESKQ